MGGRRTEGGLKTRGSEEALNADVDFVDLLVEALTLEVAGKWDRGGERKGTMSSGAGVVPWR